MTFLKSPLSQFNLGGFMTSGPGAKILTCNCACSTHSKLFYITNVALFQLILKKNNNNNNTTTKTVPCGHKIQNPTVKLI